MFTPVSVARTGVAWCRIVGGAMTAFAVLLEGLQAFTPDRIPDLHAALYSAGGVMGAALPRMYSCKRRSDRTGRLQVMLGVSSSVRRVHTELLTAFRRDRGLEARGAGRSVTAIGRPIAVADGLTATPTLLIASTSSTGWTCGQTWGCAAAQESVPRAHRAFRVARLARLWTPLCRAFVLAR